MNSLSERGIRGSSIEHVLSLFSLKEKILFIPPEKPLLS